MKVDGFKISSWDCMTQRDVYPGQSSIELQNVDVSKATTILETLLQNSGRRVFSKDSTTTTTLSSVRLEVVLDPPLNIYKKRISILGIALAPLLFDGLKHSV